MSESFDQSRSMSPGRALLLAGLFLVLVAWALVFRWTGEGDSGMHYMNLRESAEQPHFALFPWARPGWVVLLIWPALLGLTAAKIASAAITVALCWQTMRLADDLRIPHATLAGLLVIVQPLVFYLATDTMTELPFALFLVIAIRLWLHGRCLWSMAIVGYLPLVRPEGFFFGLVFGAMALYAPILPRLPGACATFARWTPAQRVAGTVIMLHGIIAWTIACWILSPAHQPLYWIYSWSWSPDSSELYGRGSIFHHVVMWPYYCGPVLLVLFLTGIRRSIQIPGMWLVWTAWLTVFLTHTVLWWGGWFGALGLMRIQTTTAFATALVCLCGWNVIRESRLARIGLPIRRIAFVVTLLLLTVVPMLYYLMNPESWHFVNNRSATKFFREHSLIDGAPRLIFSDVISTVDADAWPTRYWERRVHSPIGSPEAMHAVLRDLPVGTVGIWDNQRGQVWHHASIEQLEALGFVVLHDARFRAPFQETLHKFIKRLRKRPIEQRMVVVRKSEMRSPTTLPSIPRPDLDD